MAKTIIFDFLSDPMGGLLTSARAFLSRVRRFDPGTRIVVLELNGSISGSLRNAEEFEWVNIQKPDGLSGWRRMLWQNVNLPRLMREFEAGVYVSLSHYLPWSIPGNVKTIVGVSNLAPFSKDAYKAEIKLTKKLRLLILRRGIISASKRADRVIALSDTCLCELVCRGLSLVKISVVPNGVDLPVEIAEIDAVGCAVDGEFILCVSHFYRYKNYERLVRGYALLPESLRQRYRLLLVGRPYDVAYFESIKKLVAHLNLTERVSLIGGLYGIELSAHYRRCALFMFPTLIENSPITLLEAMAHGAPVAAADIPAMREFGGDAVTYFDPHSEKSMAQAMEAMLVDGAVSARLRTLGPQRAQQYTWDSFTEKLVQLYQKMSV
jgi:glycosyltransferase involved in cell wall biosynthesis